MPVLLPAETIEALATVAAAPGMTTPCQIVYWGLTDWEGLTQRPQLLAGELSKRYRVLYVRPAPISRRLRARGPLPPAVERLSDRLVVLRPRALSPGRLRPFAHLNDEWATRRIRAELRSDRPIILWLSHPDQAGQIGRYGERLVVFDEMDYHAGFKTGPARAAMAAAEEWLLRRADLVFASGLDLHARAVAAGARPLLVPNGVLFERFATAATRPLPPPPPVARLPRPRLLFYGTFGPWFDTALLASIARARPEWTLVLFGGGDGADLGRLAGLPNIHRLGWQPYDLLPAYLQHADLCLLPFHDTPATRAMDPVKLYEYLAAGKPVVATPLPELAKWGDLVDLAATPAEAIAAIERHLRAPEPAERRQQRLAAAARHTWAARAATISAALEAALAGQR
jgi:glycosyltransferase involved in cell wall biosynthesis